MANLTGTYIPSLLEISPFLCHLHRANEELGNTFPIMAAGPLELLLMPKVNGLSRAKMYLCSQANHEEEAYILAYELSDPATVATVDGTIFAYHDFPINDIPPAGGSPLEWEQYKTHIVRELISELGSTTGRRTRASFNAAHDISVGPGDHEFRLHVIAAPPTAVEHYWRITYPIFMQRKFGTDPLIEQLLPTANLVRAGFDTNAVMWDPEVRMHLPWFGDFPALVTDPNSGTDNTPTIHHMRVHGQTSEPLMPGPPQEKPFKHKRTSPLPLPVSTLPTVSLPLPAVSPQEPPPEHPTCYVNCALRHTSSQQTLEGPVIQIDLMDVTQPATYDIVTPDGLPNANMIVIERGVGCLSPGAKFFELHGDEFYLCTGNRLQELVERVIFSTRRPVPVGRFGFPDCDPLHRYFVAIVEARDLDNVYVSAPIVIRTSTRGESIDQLSDLVHEHNRRLNATQDLQSAPSDKWGFMIPPYEITPIGLLL